MYIYILTISVVDDTHNITRPLTPTGYKTKTTAREELALYKALYTPQEGYILKSETPDFFVFTVRTVGNSYTMTLAIESLIIN